MLPNPALPKDLNLDDAWCVNFQFLIVLFQGRKWRIHSQDMPASGGEHGHQGWLQTAQTRRIFCMETVGCLVGLNICTEKVSTLCGTEQKLSIYQHQLASENQKVYLKSHILLVFLVTK